MSIHNRLRKLLLLSVSLSIFGSPALAGSAAAQSAVPNTETWDMIRQAYIFSFPLMLMDATRTVSTNTEEQTDEKAPVNQLMHAKSLAGAEFRQVVTPNVDTLYSQIFFDLSEEPLVLHKPAADRYLMYQVMDAWSDTAAVLGTGGDGQEERTYLLTGPNYTGEIPEGMVQVQIPTSIGWIIGRTVCYGPDDLENIYEIQNRMDARPLSVYLNGGALPKGIYDAANDGIPIRMVVDMEPQTYFNRFNRLLEDNPAYTEDEAVMESFASLGIGAGLTFDASILGENAADQWKAMLGNLTDELTESAGHFMIQNGSFRFWGDPISRFGTEYDYRCLVAIAGFGANPVDAAVYMRGGNDNKGDELSGENNYVLHFNAGALPPVKENGFWSITAYGEDDFLIDNELDRYSISDRSPFTLNPDGSLDLYLQAEAPDENQENWLPVGREGFHLFMRIYQPTDDVLDGTWKAPSIIKK